MSPSYLDGHLVTGSRFFLDMGGSRDPQAAPHVERNVLSTVSMFSA